MFPLATDLAAGFTLSELTIALLVGSLILIVCVAAIRLSTRTGMPSLLIYLAVGLAVGEKGLGIGFESEQLTQVLGYAALILILAEGGLSTQWSGIRGAVGPALILSTVGVVVSVAVVATAGHYVLGWSWVTALLIGAILSSTDAAAVFAVLRNVPLPRRLTGMLEAEAGFNDAPVVILVTALSAYAAHTGEVISPLWLPFVAIAELAGGALIGLLVGYLGGRLMRLSAAGASGLFSIGIIAVTVLAYAVAASLHLSGFIATYLAALVLGNMGLPHRAAVHAFATGVGWLAQIGLFVLLGLLASPSGFPHASGPRPGHRPRAAHPGPAVVGGCLDDPVRLFASRPALLVLGRPARRGSCRPRHRARHRQGTQCRLDLRPGLRPGRHLHPGSGTDAAVGGADPRGHREPQGARDDRGVHPHG